MQTLFYSLPEGASPENPEDEVLLSLERDGVVAGRVDSVRDHPRPGAVAVGIFLLAPWERGRGPDGALAEAPLTRAGDPHLASATVPAGWRAGERFPERLGFTLQAPWPTPAEVGNRRPGPREGGGRRAESRRAGTG